MMVEHLQAGFLLSSEQGGDNGLSLQNCSPGETCNKLQVRVSTSLTAIPNHTEWKVAALTLVCLFLTGQDLK